MTCSKCNDTGWFQCDFNHTQICPQCCNHDEGFWFLTPPYQDSGKWCCGKGCGYTLAYKELMKRMKRKSGKYLHPIFMDVRITAG